MRAVGGAGPYGRIIGGAAGWADVGSASAISPCAGEALGIRIATASVRTGLAMTSCMGAVGWKCYERGVFYERG